MNAGSLLRRVRNRFCCLVEKPLLNIWLPDHRDDVFIHLVDDRFRSAARSHDGVPGYGGKAGQGGLRDGRHVRQLRCALS